MLVKDFEVLWSDRSQAHGQPRPIEAIQENILLLDKLSLLRAWENTTKHQNLQWESVRSSQNAFLSLWNERLSATDTQFPSNSQQLFSQVPVSSIKEKSAQHGTETHSPKQQDKRKDFVQSNGFPSKRNSSNDGSNTTRNRSSPRSNTGKRRKLLGLKLADGEVAGFEKQLEAKKPKNQTDRLMGILYTNRAVSSRMNGPSVASGAAATLPAVDAHNDTQAVGLDSTEIGSKSPRRVEGVNGRLEETTATSITTCETREVEHSIPQRSPKQLSDRSPTPKQDCCNEHSVCVAKLL